MTRAAHRRGVGRELLLPLVASAAGAWSHLALSGRLPARARRPWARTNHAGEPVTLLEGPAWVLGALGGGATGPDALSRTLIVLAAGATGAFDDLVGTASSKGLRGHLGALARGEVTTGAAKIGGLVVTGLVGAALTDQRDRPDPRGRRDILSTLIGGAVIAGAANAVNLFDLRPGRALKVTVLAGSALAAAGGGSTAATAVGASLGVLPDDLAARSMLGDTGANAAGALLGLALVERTGLVGRLAALAGLAGLTLASERVSFSAVIERHDLLRRLDRWGRAAS